MDAGPFRKPQKNDGESVEDRRRRDTRRHARFLRFLPDRLCAGLCRQGLGPDLWPVRRDPARLRRQRAVRFAVLRLARRQGRPPDIADPRHPQRLARYRRDGADPRARLDVLGGLPLCRRLWRDRALFGRHHADQEFSGSHNRGWITGLTTTMLPAGQLLAALLGAFAAPYIGWRGLVAVGLLPALLCLYVRAFVPESPHWLLRRGRLEEARQSLAWALMMDPAKIP